MTRRHADSVIERGPNPVRIEEGRISNVNMARWTADVRTRESQRTYYDLTWSSPYLHFHSGEGISFMPEVGAKVMVCKPCYSDPFIMSFVTPSERYTRQEGSTNTTTSDTTSEEAGTDVTYRAGRPRLQQGDLLLSTRDGNRIWLRRGGVVEIGSTRIAKRFYIPLLNYIRDVCENYDLWSAGGTMRWTVTRSDEDPDDLAYGVLSIAAKNAAQDAMATVGLKIGHVDDTSRLRISVAPGGVSPNDGDVTSAVYTLEVDDEGSRSEDVGKNADLTVAENLTWTVTGSGVLTFGDGLTMSVSGDHVVAVNGAHSLTADSSVERISGQKVIDSSDVIIGGPSARDGFVLATLAFAQFVSGHTHEILGSSTGPPTPGLMEPQYKSNHVKGR